MIKIFKLITGEEIVVEVDEKFFLKKDDVLNLEEN